MTRFMAGFMTGLPREDLYLAVTIRLSGKSSPETLR